MLPRSNPTPSALAPPQAVAVESKRERKQRERANIERALASSGGKIYGPGGAAEILGIPGTTLASRIKTLGIRRR